MIIAGFIVFSFGVETPASLDSFSDILLWVIEGLTIFYVTVCFYLLWKTKEQRGTKIKWSVILFLGNMITVPYFLWHYNKHSLHQLVNPRKTSY